MAASVPQPPPVAEWAPQHFKGLFAFKSNLGSSSFSQCTVGLVKCWVLTEYVLPDLEETQKLLWVMFNTWLNADDIRRGWGCFGRRRMGCRAHSAPSSALAVLCSEMNFFLWKLFSPFSRHYIGCICPFLHNLFLQWLYVCAKTFHLNSSCSWTILGFPFCPLFLWLTWTQGVQELWSFLMPLQNNFSQWGSLAQAKPCLQMRMHFPIDSNEPHSLLRPLFGF